MSNDLDALTAVLTRYISPVNARALLSRALRENGLADNGSTTRRELLRCDRTLRQGLQLFVPSSQRNDALRDLDSYFRGERAALEGCSIKVLSEEDVGVARSAARRLCDQIGADPFSMQKVTTIVSELARNIVLYAQQGAVEIDVRGRNGRTLGIRAVDRGPGIPNLEHILSGAYKSRTGLGRGLLGTKRLADRFDISTSSQGTEINVEVMV